MSVLSERIIMSFKNIYAVILAGGSGTRFWPESRQQKPKQFLRILGDVTLLEATIKRILPLIPAQNILIVTNQAYVKEIRKQSKVFQIPTANILLEPEARNTAPAICWSAAWIYKKDPQAKIIVLPSDHLILKEKKFHQVLKQALQLAEEEFLVTLGIRPTRPDTGYGYLKTQLTKNKAKSIYKVAQFLEKPNLAKAKQLIKSKNYLWNSGMFIWKAETILAAFDEFLPKMTKAFQQGVNQTSINKFWGKLERVSIDYGIMEKAKNVVTVPAEDIGWSDLGSWDSLVDVLQADKKGNVLQAESYLYDCKNILVRGHSKPIAVIGLEDVMIIDTPDTLLVCKKGRSQDVREIVEQLKFKKAALL